MGWEKSRLVKQEKVHVRVIISKQSYSVAQWRLVSMTPPG